MSSQPISIPPRTRYLSWDEQSALQEQSLVFACKQHIDQYGWSADFAKLYGDMPELRNYDSQDPPEFCHGVTAAQHRVAKRHNGPPGIRPPRRQLIDDANSNGIPKQHTITKKDKSHTTRPMPHIKTAAPQCQNDNEYGQKGKQSVCCKLTDGTKFTREQKVVPPCPKRNVTANQAQEHISHNIAAGWSKRFEVCRLLPRRDGSGNRAEDEKLSDYQVDECAIESDYFSDGEVDVKMKRKLLPLLKRHEYYTGESDAASASGSGREIQHVEDRELSNNIEIGDLPSMGINLPRNTKPRRHPTGTAGPSIPQPVFRPPLESKMHVRRQLKQQDLATITSKLKLRELVRHARNATSIQGYRDNREHHDLDTIEVDIDLWNLKI